MSTPWRQRHTSALDCTPPGTLTWLHFSFRTLGSRTALSLTSSRLLPLFWACASLTTFRPLHTAQAVHEVVTEEYRILESVNNELATSTPADWVCPFETCFSLSVEHRRHFPQGTGSLLSLLALVPFRGSCKPGPVSRQ